MNLEIASRLVGLRKANNLSQEALAEKLGISRQAVSKWERAEASPDTDNLIALAKLYHVSLDELLLINEEETGGADDGRVAVREDEDPGYDKDVRIGYKGIHVRERNGDEVHVGWDGIHVHDGENEVHIDKNGVFVNGEEARGHIFAHGKKEVEVPVWIFAIVIYIALGVCFDLWHPGWLIIFLVPVVSTLIEAVRRRDASRFAYPCLVVFLFLYAGFAHSRWHPAWVLFLTIPLYYPFVEYVHDRRAQKEEKDW